MANLIFGCGYLGRRVAERWIAAGEMVHAVTRSSERAQELAAIGVSPIVADILRPDSLAGLPAARTVLFAVGHDRASGAPIGQVFTQGLQAALDAAPTTIERFIYVSSTGVYADAAGEWIDEESLCEPATEGGRAALAAEMTLTQHALGIRGVVLRMAGLYGPGRIPRANDLLAGRPIDAPADGALNLIHVEDAAAVVVAAAERAAPPRVYNVSDGNPAVRRDYYAELARLIGAAPPRFASPPAGAPATERARTDKRVSNSRLVADLGVSLRYPSYREGLAAIVAAR